MFQFKLPDLGEGIAEAEVVQWLVREGDAVREDQPIAEVTTDKALLEISSPRAGRVHRLCGKEGDIIPVGQVLIEIDDGVAPGEARPAEPAPDERAEGQKAEEGLPAAPALATTAPPPPPPAPSPAPERPVERRRPPRLPPRPQAHPMAAPLPSRRSVDAVPAVRELAKQLGVDLSQVPGTGPEGRVMRRDVEAFYEAMQKGLPPATPASPEAPASPDEPDWTRRPLRGIRRQVAERMVRAKTFIPHYTYVEEIDVTALEEKRRALAEGQEKVSPLAFIAHATVRVLPRYPQMNACLDDQTGEVIYKGKVHLGIAVATEEGLLVPVIRDAAGRDVAELAAMIRDLADRARARRLDPLELRGSTFTITSLGRLGGVLATPIINYPASAILGVHAIRTLPRYVDGQVAPREVLNLSISLDHRVVDGFEGARFIQEVKEILEQADFPEFK
jgi:2-oxoisovalerate dehydrogenase E2 component (dihydrolipoyl transacylase)